MTIRETTKFVNPKMTVHQFAYFICFDSHNAPTARVCRRRSAQSTSSPDGITTCGRPISAAGSNRSSRATSAAAPVTTNMSKPFWMPLIKLRIKMKFCCAIVSYDRNAFSGKHPACAFQMNDYYAGIGFCFFR